MDKKKLNNFAKKLAELTLIKFSGSPNFEALDGDATEYLTKRFLIHLDRVMANN